MAEKAEKKEKLFEVKLKRGKLPTVKGKEPESGVIYQRGGFQFTMEKDYHVVTEAELEKFKLAKHRTFASEPVEFEIDQMLVVREVSG